jgi:hypothetical protein
MSDTNVVEAIVSDETKKSEPVVETTPVVVEATPEVKPEIKIDSDAIFAHGNADIQRGFVVGKKPRSKTVLQTSFEYIRESIKMSVWLEASNHSTKKQAKTLESDSVLREKFNFAKLAWLIVNYLIFSANAFMLSSILEHISAMPGDQIDAIQARIREYKIGGKRELDDQYYDMSKIDLRKIAVLMQSHRALLNETFGVSFAEKQESTVKATSETVVAGTEADFIAPAKTEKTKRKNKDKQTESPKSTENTETQGESEPNPPESTGEVKQGTDAVGTLLAAAQATETARINSDLATNEEKTQRNDPLEAKIDAALASPVVEPAQVESKPVENSVTPIVEPQNTESNDKPVESASEVVTAQTANEESTVTPSVAPATENTESVVESKPVELPVEVKAESEPAKIVETTPSVEATPVVETTATESKPKTQATPRPAKGTKPTLIESGTGSGGVNLKANNPMNPATTKPLPGKTEGTLLSKPVAADNAPASAKPNGKDVQPPSADKPMSKNQQKKLAKQTAREASKAKQTSPVAGL